MIIDELAARFSFSIEGLEKVRRAIEMFKRLQRVIVAFAVAVAQRLGRVAGILLKTSAAAAALGTAFVAKAAVITAAAGAATGALGLLAAAFARMRRETVDTGLINGIPIKELSLVENLMTRIGASAKDGRKFVTDFVEKLREGVKDGGDWKDALGKQKVKITDKGGKARPYSAVIDDILRAADKMKDVDKRRGFLKEALEGAPDELLSQLAQATSAFEKWKSLVNDTRKLTGGGMTSGDILNVQDITDGLGRIQAAIKGFTDAFASGIMASFSQDFRKLGDAIASVATDENRAKVRQFAGSMVEFFSTIRQGGATVLSAVATAFGGLTNSLSKIDDATGGRLSQLATGLAALLAAVSLTRAAPILAVSAAITGVLYAIGEFQKWNAGGESPLKDFFDTISDAATSAKNAVEGLLGALRNLPSLKSLISPDVDPNAPAADTPAAKRRSAIQNSIDGQSRLRGGDERPNEGGGPVYWLKKLFEKQAEMDPGRQTQKIARDREVASSTDSRSYSDIGNDQRTISVTNNLNVADPSGVAAAAAKGVLGAISTKGANTSTGALTAP